MTVIYPSSDRQKTGRVVGRDERERPLTAEEQEFAVSHIGLAFKVANKWGYRCNGYTFDDAMSDCLMVLVKSAKYYDPSYGWKPSTYIVLSMARRCVRELKLAQSRSQPRGEDGPSVLSMTAGPESRSVMRDVQWHGLSPMEAAELKEEEDRKRDAIRDLFETYPKLMDVLRLRSEGQSQAAVAAKMGLTTHLVKLLEQEALGVTFKQAITKPKADAGGKQ